MKLFQYMFITALITSIAINAGRKPDDRQITGIEKTDIEIASHDANHFTPLKELNEVTHIPVAAALALLKTPAPENQPLVTVQNIETETVIPVIDNSHIKTVNGGLSRSFLEEKKFGSFCEHIEKMERFQKKHAGYCSKHAEKSGKFWARLNKTICVPAGNSSPTATMRPHSALQLPTLEDFFPPQYSRKNDLPKHSTK